MRCPRPKVAVISLEKRRFELCSRTAASHRGHLIRLSRATLSRSQPLPGQPCAGCRNAQLNPYSPLRKLQPRPEHPEQQRPCNPKPHRNNPPPHAPVCHAPKPLHHTLISLTADSGPPAPPRRACRPRCGTWPDRSAGRPRRRCWAESSSAHGARPPEKSRPLR